VRKTDDVGVADGSPATTENDPLLRFAMLSVYYASLGRQFEIRGAPSVLLPPQVRPLELPAALDLLSTSPFRLREALWLIVRGVRAQALPSEHQEDYPSELEDYIVPGSLSYLRQLRREYRAGANIFAAALVACRDGFWRQFAALLKVMQEESSAAPLGFSSVTSLTLGMTAPDYLDRISSSPHQRELARRQVERLECDVGLNIYDFVDELADAAAFDRFSKAYLRHPPPAGGSLTVFPVSSIVRQDSKTLLTTATVTTLVQGEFATLCRVVDPQWWSRSSDVIQHAAYVSDPFSLASVRSSRLPPLGAGFTGTRLLDEAAVMSWGENNDQQGSFRNVLNIQHTVGDQDQFIDVKFWLHRSIDSAILWDHRAGGLQLNQGYLKVRPLAENTWRITSRKILRFADRTPRVGASGWLDFGQILNYLAPAALTWWVESETYSMGDTIRPDSEAAPSTPAVGLSEVTSS
jgi:hypothetical protein